MKYGEKGFTIVELVVALAIITLISSAAVTTIFQIIPGTKRSNDYMTAIRQVQNAGYWISHDVRIAEGATADGLELPSFLILTWTEQDYGGGDPIYHSVTYFFADLSDTIGTLKRNHWSSAGVNEETLIAEYIYYNPDDPDNTSKANYVSPVLTVQLTAVSGEATAMKEYRARHRPNL